MKKQILIVLALSILLAVGGVCLSGCMHEPTKTEKSTDSEVLHYKIEAELDAKSKRLKGVVNVRYTLPETQTTEIWAWAPMGVESATCDEQAMAVDRQGVYTRLSLAAPAANRQVALTMAFEAEYARPDKLQVVRDYIPLLCAYENGGYARPAACSFAHYAAPAAGDVHLTLRLSPSLVAVTNAQTAERRYMDEYQLLDCRWQCADGCMLATGPHLIRSTATVGDTTWEYYADTPNELTRQAIQQTAQNAHTLWGECPRQRVAVVYDDEATCYAGMATINTGKVTDITQAVVSQWCAIQPDAAYPWVAASLRAYSLWRYMHAYNEEKAAETLQTARHAAVEYGVLHGATGDNARLDKPLCDYDEDSYSVLLTQKGLLMWYTLQEVAGKEANRAAMSLCAQTTLTPEQVIANVGRITNSDYRYFFDAWLTGNVLLA